MSTQRKQSRLGAMAAQLEAFNRQSESLKSPRINTTVEQLLRGEASKFGREHDMEYDHTLPKKSVLAKVKEKARKWRNTLSKKKNNEDNNTTPSWGVSLEDDEDEDPEYLGAPMYESEMAPEGYKEAARQNPRAVPVIPENHALPSSPRSESGKGREGENKSEVDRRESEAEKKSSNDDQPVNKTMIETHDAEETTKTSTEAPTEKPAKTFTEAVTEKLAPACATVSDATQAIASKIQSLTISTIQTLPPISANKSERSPGAADHKSSSSPANEQEAPGSAPAAAASGEHPSTSEQLWDKRVSVKEYIMHKLEPGEDERALSEVISEVISPRRKSGKVSVVEKVKEAVTSVLRNQERSHDSPRLVYHTAHNSLAQFPNSYEVVEEENHGRILQAN